MEEDNYTAVSNVYNRSIKKALLESTEGLNRVSHCRESEKTLKSRWLWGEICKIRLLLGGKCEEENLNRGGNLWINMKTNERMTWSRCPIILTGL